MSIIKKEFVAIVALIVSIIALVHSCNIDALHQKPDLQLQFMSEVIIAKTEQYKNVHLFALYSIANKGRGGAKDVTLRATWDAGNGLNPWYSLSSIPFIEGFAYSNTEQLNHEVPYDAGAYQSKAKKYMLITEFKWTDINGKQYSHNENFELIPYYHGDDVGYRFYLSPITLHSKQNKQ